MGAFIKKITRLDESLTFVIQKLSIEFRNVNIDDYIQEFNLLKKENIVIEGSFSDSIWHLLTRDGTYTINFYSISKNTNIILALKIYIIILLSNQKRAIATLKTHVDAISYIIMASDDLNITYYEGFKDNLEKLYYDDSKYYKLYYVVRLGIKFLKFYDKELMRPIIECLGFYKIARNHESRELPSFASALWFDYIIHDFYNKSSKEERNRYAILWLWWFITSVIPMRPGEFLHIRRNCTREDEGKYYLSIPTGAKTKKLIRGKERFREVRITKMLYLLIDDFKKSNTSESNNVFLFDYEDYRKTFYVDINNNKVLKEYWYNKIGTYRFSARIDDFYIRVVEKEYGIKTTSVGNQTASNGELVIERIRPGDTRHFAICNLYLQGHNPLTIARLAGHEHMNTQLTYANHMGFFAESNVKVLVDMFKRDGVFGNNFRDTHFLNDSIRKSIINKSKKNEFQREVDKGICIDKEFPNNCIGSCSGCIYRIENKKYKDINESDKWSNEIDKQINIMIKIIKNTQLTKYLVDRNRNYDTEDQNKFGAASKKLQTAIYKKAISEYRIFKQGCIE